MPTPHDNALRRPPPTTVWLGLGAALMVAVLLATTTGAFAISIPESLAIFAHALGLGAPATAGGFTEQQQTVLLSIRLPRVLLGVLVGAGLAAAGAALQGLFRNPLADPGLIGISSGAALAATFVIVLGATWLPGLSKILGGYTLPFAAFCGGLAVSALIYRIAAGHGGAVMAVMLLAGIGMNALAGAGIGLFTYLANDEQLRNLTFWNLGSLAGGSWQTLGIVGPVVIAALVILLREAEALNALLLGEAEAGHLGVNVARLKSRIIVCTALVVGPLVAMTGVIGFVALVAPHLIRLICGPDHRLLLPAAALLGATLIVIADIAARLLVAPAELPIGILTAILGTPFFLGLLLKERRAWRPT